MNEKIISRKSSWSSQKSFHSIDEFKYSTPSLISGKRNKFPIRPTINIFLILLTTLQVFLLISSRIYLRGELVRTFLSVYIDEDKYPQVFDGKQFYIQIIGIQQLKEHFDYLFKRVNVIDKDSFVDFYYKDAHFILHAEYKEFAGSQHRNTVFPIDPKVGIKEPFDMNNITNMQLFLLQIEEFQIQIDNLMMKENWEGFSERYLHEITYRYINSIKVEINFNFKINNAMVNPNDDKHESNLKSNDDDWMSMTKCIKSGCYFKNKKNNNANGNFGQVPYPTTYIVKVRVFYCIVFIFALVSLYLNFISIRQTYKIFYQQLQSAHNEDCEHQQSEPNILRNKQEEEQTRKDVKNWLKINKISITEIKLQHYFHILQFDVIFSTLSNIFEIIAAFYLITGNEKERVAGVVCLFSWLTIFKFIRSYKKLSLMYELIKLSISKVIKFFIQFLPVFLSYALLGMCLFPKVSFFSSMADSVTTLVCLMMGDSIQMITDAILQKNSVFLTIMYIFSFVLLFMHAIHNTLTSLIKEFFIIKKIQLVKWEKQIKGDQRYVYIEEMKMAIEKEKAQLPLKLTNDLARGILRIKALSRTKFYKKIAIFLCHQLENIQTVEKWIIQQDELYKFSQVKEELVRRALILDRIINNYDVEDTGKKKGNKGGYSSYIQSSQMDSGIKQSLLTDKD